MGKNTVQKKSAYILVLLGILFTMGCGSSDKDTEDTEDTDVKEGYLFKGSWRLYEDHAVLNCPDADEFENGIAKLEINQSNGKASVNFPDAGMTFDCEINDTTLDCPAKEFTLEDGGFLHMSDLWMEYQEMYYSDTFEVIRYLYAYAEFTLYDVNHANPCRRYTNFYSVPLTASISDGGQQASLRINNNRKDAYELLNIIPCDDIADMDMYNWGANLLKQGTWLPPHEYYQKALDSAGCYNIRACLDPATTEDEDSCAYILGVHVAAAGINVFSLDD